MARRVVRLAVLRLAEGRFADVRRFVEARFVVERLAVDRFAEGRLAVVRRLVVDLRAEAAVRLAVRRLAVVLRAEVVVRLAERRLVVRRLALAPVVLVRLVDRFVLRRFVVAIGFFFLRGALERMRCRPTVRGAERAPRAARGSRRPGHAPV